MEPNDQDFVFTRTVDAPRELVWKAWTEAQRLEHWWGPKGFTLTVNKLELKPGGLFHYRMSTDKNEMWGRFKYTLIEPISRLEYVSSFSDPDGNIISAPIIDGFPLEVNNMLTFEETGDGKTIVSLRGRPADNATEAQRAVFAGLNSSMQQGFGGTFDQLDAYLAEIKKG